MSYDKVLFKKSCYVNDVFNKGLDNEGIKVLSVKCFIWNEKDIIVSKKMSTLSHDLKRYMYDYSNF